MKNHLINILLVFFLNCFLISASNPQNQNILILNSYHQNSPWTSKVLDGILDNLEQNFPDAEIYIENLDTKRFFSEEYITAYNELLKKKYEGLTFDIIITSDNNALDYLLKKSFFEIDKIPKVFCGINHFNPNLLQNYKLLYGVPEQFDIKDNVELIKQFNPNLEKLTLITDITVTGRAIKVNFNEEIRNYNLSVEYLDSLSYESLMNSVKNKTEDDVIIYTLFNKDIDGNYYEAGALLDKLREQTSAQIYSFSDFNFGHGIIGGKLIHGYEQGKAASEIVKKILLNSDKIEDNFVIRSPNKFMFDYRQLENFDLLDENLPANSEVHFKPLIYWDASKLKILTILLGSIILILLVIIILRNLRLKYINKELKLKFEENLVYNEQLRKYSSALDQSANVIVITDLEANIEYVNKKFETVTGYTFEEVKGKNTNILKAERADKNIIIDLWQRLAEGKTWTGEFENRKKDGTLFWEYATISPIRNISGKITNYIAIKEDVTEKKQKERRMTQLNRLLELKVQCNLALLLSNNEKQLCQEHCKIFLDVGKYDLAFIQYLQNKTLTGNTPEYSASKFDVDLSQIGFHSLTCNTCTISKVLEFFETAHYHVINEIEDKNCLLSKHEFNSVISLPIIYKDQVFGIFTLYTRMPSRFDEEEIKAIYDITYMLGFGINTFREQKIKEEIEIELAQEKEELTTTLSSLNEGVITLNQDATITISNKSASKILGTISPMFEKNIFEVIDIEEPQLKDEFKNNIFNMLNGKINSFMMDHVNLALNEESKIISINASVISKTDNTSNGMVLILRDITELVKKESQSALSQKLESIGSLASGIAHEINTPLQFVNDNTTFLGDSFKALLNIIDELSSNKEIKTSSKEILDEYDYEFLAEEIPDAIKQSKEGLLRVGIIVKAMKDFAHTSNARKIYSDLNKGIDVTAAISRNEWKYVADLELDLGKNLPKVYCCPEEINQVILNMIVNSSHAIEEKFGAEPDEKGKIKIKTLTENNHFRIEISDNGIGIKKDKISKIFDPFFTTKEVGKGTGQGLSITHDIIINKHSGQLEVESEYGKGTKIIINLPIENHE